MARKRKPIRWALTEPTIIRREALAILNTEGPVEGRVLARRLNCSVQDLNAALGEDVWMLKPENFKANSKTYTDAQIIKAIKKVARLYGEPVTMAKYDTAKEKGKIDGPTHVRIMQRWGTWRKAVEAAGFEAGTGRNNYTQRYTDEELWEFVVRFITEHDNTTFSEWGVWKRRHAPEAPSAMTIRNRLGIWTDVYTEAARRVIEENNQAA